MQKVLVIGYGSIGRQHVNNLISLGCKPYVLTSYPEENPHIKFITSLKECEDIEYSLICSPTSRHLDDFINITENFSCKRVFIEKPVDALKEKALIIKQIAYKLDIDVFIGYDMRFLGVFEIIKEFIKNHRSLIRLVEIKVGQYLPEWRPYKDYRKSYSSIRALGGGVDLDLSHEIDYMIWLFGIPDSKLFNMTDKISNLEIDSPDYFKGIYKYSTFLVDVELDYIRSLERKMRIIGENKILLDVNFIGKSLKVLDEYYSDPTLFDFKSCLVEEMKEFLNMDFLRNLANLDDGIKVFDFLN